MNILHVVPTYYPATYWGGPIYSVYKLNNELVKYKDVRLKVLTTDAAGPELHNQIDINKAKEFFREYEVFFFRRVAKVSVSLQLILKLRGYVKWSDVVHLTGVYSFPTIPTLFLCWIYNKPVVWSMRGAILESAGWSESSKKQLKRVWELVCNLFIRDKYVTLHVTSTKEDKYTIEKIPRAKSIIIANGVDLQEKIINKKWLKGGTLRLIFIGRISPTKGIENLLKAMSALKKYDIELKLYGMGDKKYINKINNLFHELDLDKEKVTFMGYVEGNKKKLAYEQGDICIIPSHTENFCNVVTESLSYGVPVIASTGTPWERVNMIGCGLWVDNSPESLVEAIKIMGDKDLNEMGRLGRKWVEKEFSWEYIGSRFYDEYKRKI